MQLTNRESLTQHLRDAHNVQSGGRGETIHLTCLKCALVCSNIEELRLHETGHLASATAPMLINRVHDQPDVRLFSRDRYMAIQVLPYSQPAENLTLTGKTRQNLVVTGHIQKNPAMTENNHPNIATVSNIISEEAQIYR